MQEKTITRKSPSQFQKEIDDAFNVAFEKQFPGVVEVIKGLVDIREKYDNFLNHL
jgi:hypothetical protein